MIHEVHKLKLTCDSCGCHTFEHVETHPHEWVMESLVLPEPWHYKEVESSYGHNIMKRLLLCGNSKKKSCR